MYDRVIRDDNNSLMMFQHVQHLFQDIDLIQMLLKMVQVPELEFNNDGP